MEDFNTTKYWQDGVLYLENLKIQNCRLVSLQSEWVKKSLVMKKCVFEKVVFDNHCGRGFFQIDNCEFLDCTIYDTLGSGKLDVQRCSFKNCVFEGMSLHDAHLSRISKCKFLGCNFKNVDLKWRVALFGIEMKEGKIEHSCIMEGGISDNQIYNMQIEDVELSGSFYNNRMESVMFKNVHLVGEKGMKGSEKENIFVNCDTKSLSFVEDSLRILKR